GSARGWGSDAPEGARPWLPCAIASRRAHLPVRCFHRLVHSRLRGLPHERSTPYGGREEEPMLQFHRSVALVRRSESRLQFGVDDPVLIDGLTDGDFALIDRLCRGCDPDDYLEVAHRRGVNRTRALSLLDLLTEAGVLAPPEAAAGGPVVRDHVEPFA